MDLKRPFHHARSLSVSWLNAWYGMAWPNVASRADRGSSFRVSDLPLCLLALLGEPQMDILLCLISELQSVLHDIPDIDQTMLAFFQVQFSSAAAWTRS